MAAGVNDSVLCAYMFKYLSRCSAASARSRGTKDLRCIVWDRCGHRLSSWDAGAYLLHGTWVLSSLTRDGTHVPCIARQMLNHWTTREVPHCVSERC